MARSEQQFIQLCKKQIERRFSFGNGQGYTQRDLEVLSAHIEEKTGVVISLSTLKRLWKDDYKQSPQLATLNALAVVLDYKDWQSFKLANQGKPGLPVLKWMVPALVVVIAIAVGIVIWSLSARSKANAVNKGTGKKIKQPVKIMGPVRFEASKTVTSGIPNTVIFKYDVSNVDADTFYIQQSWNEYQRIGLDAADSVITSIYYESGFHRARLMANDSVIDVEPVHIISNGWEPHIYYDNADPMPIDFKNEKFRANGRFSLAGNALDRQKVDRSKRFFSRISNSQVFGVHSDNFSFSTRMKVDSLHNLLCSWMGVIIVTDVNIFRVLLTEKGCEINANYKLGEISRTGINNDLSALGCNVYDWQELKVQVKNRHAAVYLNNKLAFEEVYRENMGKVMGLIFIFDGIGSIDYVRLADKKDEVVFLDDFD